MQAASEGLEIAKRECKAHGVPITSKRLNVFSVLLSSEKALSAYELADSYKLTFEEPVPVITVYRVLEFLQSKNLVHKLETANKYVACAYTNCNHQHSASQSLICSECLKVTELRISKADLEQLKKTIDRAGFHLSNPQLEMNCICKACFIDAK
jgi:Fur family zinc uptake transcriptional regulator